MNDPIVRIGPAAHYHVDHRGQPVGEPRDFEPTPARSTARDLGRRYPSGLSVLVTLVVVGLTALFVLIRWWDAIEGGR